MPVSIPEKTLEHWTSTYLTYRYRSHLAMWWPVDGADIQVGSAGLAVGKSIWLELKTATVEPTGVGDEHKVIIDIEQLDNYMHRTTGLPWAPAYYVFPKPEWLGSIDDPRSKPWLDPTPRTELAFSRSADKWFATWMNVVPAWSLYRSAHAEIDRLRRAGELHQKRKRQLGKYRGGVWTWAPLFRRPAHPTWAWRDFWDIMQVCGSTEMPALFSLASPVGGSVNRPRLVNELEVSQKPSEEWLLQPATDFYVPSFSTTDQPTGQYVQAERAASNVRPTDNASDMAFSSLITIAPAGLTFS